jgi:hypothetical protein
MKPATMLIAATLLATTALSNIAEAAPPLFPPTVYTINWYNDTFPATACSVVSVRTLASNGAPITEKTNGADLAYRKTLIMDIPSAGCAAIKPAEGKPAPRISPAAAAWQTLRHQTRRLLSTGESRASLTHWFLYVDPEEREERHQSRRHQLARWQYRCT